MEKQTLYINGISSVLWGAASKRLFIAVHGDSSHKEDDVIRIFAERAVEKGYQVLNSDGRRRAFLSHAGTACMFSGMAV